MTCDGDMKLNSLGVLHPGSFTQNRAKVGIALTCWPCSRLWGVGVGLFLSLGSGQSLHRHKKAQRSGNGAGGA